MKKPKSKKKLKKNQAKKLNLQPMANFFKKHWKKIVIVGLLVMGGGWWRHRAIQANKPQLTFTQPAYQNLTKTLEVSGVVDAKEKALLRFAAGGKVVYLGAKEGEVVKKWQTIATIDQRTLQKKFQQDLNIYMKERWDFEGAIEDYDYDVETLDTRRSLDKTQWDLENEVLDVEIRDIAITNTVLSAPFDGVLVSSPTKVTGVNLLATEGFELINPETLVFKAAVDEADIAQVSLGQQGQIYLDSYPDEAISSTVSYIAYKNAAGATGTVFVVELPIQGENLLQTYRLGMNGDVKIVLDTRDNVLTIPFETTRERDNKVYVDVKVTATDDEYQEREIETGLETEDYVEVISGLSENDEILVPEN